MCGYTSSSIGAILELSRLPLAHDMVDNRWIYLLYSDLHVDVSTSSAVYFDLADVQL